MASVFDRAPDRRDPTRLNKWTFYPQDVIPMWVADMDFRSPPPVLAALHKAVDHGVLGYELPSRALLETVAGRMQRLYGWKVAPEMVVPVTGIVSGFSVAMRTLCTQKKGYLIQTPVYNEFHSLQANVDVPKYEAPLLGSARGNILHYEIDWRAFEKQVKRARVFLLCNPHNPLGIVFSRKDLRRMAEICPRTGRRDRIGRDPFRAAAGGSEVQPAGEVIVGDRESIHYAGRTVEDLQCAGAFLRLCDHTRP